MKKIISILFLALLTLSCKHEIENVSNPTKLQDNFNEDLGDVQIQLPSIIASGDDKHKASCDHVLLIMFNKDNFTFQSCQMMQGISSTINFSLPIGDWSCYAIFGKFSTEDQELIILANAISDSPFTIIEDQETKVNISVNPLIYDYAEVGPEIISDKKTTLQVNYHILNDISVLKYYGLVELRLIKEENEIRNYELIEVGGGISTNKFFVDFPTIQEECTEEVTVFLDSNINLFYHIENESEDIEIALNKDNFGFDVVYMDSNSCPELFQENMNKTIYYTPITGFGQVIINWN